MRAPAHPAKAQPAPASCPTCGKRTGHECGRVECGNRRTLTAGPGCDPTTFSTYGQRKLPILQGG